MKVSVIKENIKFIGGYLLPPFKKKYAILHVKCDHHHDRLTLLALESFDDNVDISMAWVSIVLE
jgi:hypothetical protein